MYVNAQCASEMMETICPTAGMHACMHAADVSDWAQQRCRVSTADCQARAHCSNINEVVNTK